MKNMLKFSILIIVLLLPSVANAQNRFDICRVSTSWWSAAMGGGSGNLILGEFQATVGDVPTIKSFRQKGSGLVVNVGIKYEYYASYGSKPYAIKLALAVSQKEEDVFEFLDNAVAGTNYGKNWGSLYVEKKVVVGKLEHTFTIVCEDRNMKRNSSGGK
jgi:hypothetical protein